jgi:hypothetical protein
MVVSPVITCLKLIRQFFTRSRRKAVGCCCPAEAERRLRARRNAQAANPFTNSTAYEEPEA